MRAWVVSQLVADSIRSASASQPLSGVARQLERFLAGRDELFRRRGDLDALELAVMAHDVLDRRRHHRLAAGEIFGSLGRRDELRRFVHRERHQRDVPARQIGRQLGDRSCRRDNGCWAASADRPRVIFTTGPTITNDQSGRISRDLGRAARCRSARRSRRRSRAAGAAGLPGRRGRTRRARALAKCARSTDDGKQWTLWWRSFFASYRLEPPVKTTSARSISSCSSSSRCAGANLNFDSSSIAS